MVKTWLINGTMILCTNCGLGAGRATKMYIEPLEGKTRVNLATKNCPDCEQKTLIEKKY